MLWSYFRVIQSYEMLGSGCRSDHAIYSLFKQTRWSTCLKYLCTLYIHDSIVWPLNDDLSMWDFQLRQEAALKLIFPRHSISNHNSSFLSIGLSSISGKTRFMAMTGGFKGTHCYRNDTVGHDRRTCGVLQIWVQYMIVQCFCGLHSGACILHTAYRIVVLLKAPELGAA